MAAPNSDRLGAAVPSSYYEIRVTSVLPPEVLLDFDRLNASVEPVETVVHGPLRDQADLNGLLARLETFGVQVLEIRRLKDRDPPAAERPLSSVPDEHRCSAANVPAAMVPAARSRPGRGLVRLRAVRPGARVRR